MMAWSPRRHAVVGLTFALVGWYPLGVGSVVAIDRGLRSMRNGRAVGDRPAALLGGIAGALGLAGLSWPISWMMAAWKCTGHFFFFRGTADVVALAGSFAAPPLLTVVYVLARPNPSAVGHDWISIRGLAAILLGLLVAASLMWALFAAFLAADSGCF